LAGDVDALVIAYVIVSILLNVALYGYVGSLLGRVVNSLRKTDPVSPEAKKNT
jgi:hypothetical protein